MQQNMAYDYSKLRGRIVEKFGTNKAFASEVGSSEIHISNILNNKSELTRSNIIKWAKALSIPNNEIGIYFFTIKV